MPHGLSPLKPHFRRNVHQKHTRSCHKFSRILEDFESPRPFLSCPSPTRKQQGRERPRKRTRDRMYVASRAKLRGYKCLSLSVAGNTEHFPRRNCREVDRGCACIACVGRISRRWSRWTLVQRIKLGSRLRRKGSSEKPCAAFPCWRQTKPVWCVPLILLFAGASRDSRLAGFQTSLTASQWRRAGREVWNLEAIVWPIVWPDLTSNSVQLSNRHN